jgi:methyl-accepting chemotaxis protein
VKKIRTKIAVLVASGIFITLLPLSFLAVGWLEHQASEDLKREARITADFLSDAVSASVDLEDGDSVQRALESATRRKNIVFIQVYTTDEELLTAYQVERAKYIRFPKRTEKPQSFDPAAGIVVALYPIPSPIDNNVSIGTFVLGMSTESLEERTRQFRIAGVVISVSLFLVGSAIAWIIGTKIANPVMRLSQISRQIANGDLAQSVTPAIKLSDEIGELAHSFDYMRESLQHLISHIRQAGFKMQLSTDDIFTAVNQLAAALEQQSASMLETTATMEAMTATFRQISGNTDAVVTRADQTSMLSQKGAVVAEETIQKMQEIHNTNREFLEKITTLGERSEKIGDVIQIIHNIADRTKLIAFNAALEAIGTKDITGKRFNVVAIEIRRLADTIIESTQEIETNILEIQQWIRELVSSSGITTTRISEGARHTETTANWLREILEAAIHTTDEAKQIALAIQEQQLANEQILLALKEISNGTKQFVNASNQLSNSDNEMKRLADEFRGLINTFELEDVRYENHRMPVLPEQK